MNKTLIGILCVNLIGCGTFHPSSTRNLSEVRSINALPGNNGIGEVVGTILQVHPLEETDAIIEASKITCPSLSAELSTYKGSKTASVWWFSPSIAMSSRTIRVLVPDDIEQHIQRGTVVHIFVVGKCIGVSRITGLVI